MLGCGGAPSTPLLLCPPKQPLCCASCSGKSPSRSPPSCRLQTTVFVLQHPLPVPFRVRIKHRAWIPDIQTPGDPCPCQRRGTSHRTSGVGSGAGPAQGCLKRIFYCSVFSVSGRAAGILAVPQAERREKGEPWNPGDHCSPGFIPPSSRVPQQSLDIPSTSGHTLDFLL